MRAREAKDLLVQQTAEQAQLDGVPFSDLEKRMMYFTETEEMSEDPIKLNDEFEVEYGSDDYEAKISRLLHRAYARIKKEDPEAARQWNEAIRELGKGDHYLSVLWNGPGNSFTISTSFWKLLGGGLLILFVCMIAFVAYLHHGDSIPARTSPGRTTTPLPDWLKYSLFGLIIGMYLAFLALPRQLDRAFGWLIKNTLGRISHEQQERK